MVHKLWRGRYNTRLYQLPVYCLSLQLHFSLLALKIFFWTRHDAEFCQQRALERHCRAKGLLVLPPGFSICCFRFLPTAVASRALGRWLVALTPMEFSDTPKRGFRWVSCTYPPPPRLSPPAPRRGISCLLFSASTPGISWLPTNCKLAVAQGKQRSPRPTDCSQALSSAGWTPAWEGGGPRPSHSPMESGKNAHTV